MYVLMWNTESSENEDVTKNIQFSHLALIMTLRGTQLS